jgi:hypothetical protein
MGFYYDHIVPHLVNLALRNRLLKAYRERIVGLAEGRVLEIGIGSGMSQQAQAAAVVCSCFLRSHNSTRDSRRSGRSRMQDPSLSQSRPRGFCLAGTLRPSRRQIRWTRSLPTHHPAH